MKSVKGGIYGVLKLPKRMGKNAADDSSDDEDFITISFDLTKNLKKQDEVNSYDKIISIFEIENVCEASKHIMFTGNDKKKLEDSFLSEISQFGVAVTLGGRNLCYGVTFIEIEKEQLNQQQDRIRDVVFVVESIELYDISI
jgi:hypothetical protein